MSSDPAVARALRSPGKLITLSQPRAAGGPFGRLERLAPVVAASAAAAVLSIGLAYGARAVGGTDSFGYVSQAYLWLHGTPKIDQPLAAQVPWPYPDESLAPLGYRGAAGHTIVPSYPPGVPVAMAAAYLLWGACGPYYVGPLFAAVLVLVTYGLTRQLGGTRLTAALAATLMAGSPVLLINVMAPMSDTPAAALWMAALLLAAHQGRAPAFGAGCAAGAALAMRPNLAPLAVALMLAAGSWTQTGCGPPRIWRAVLVLAGILPAAGLLAFENARLYGSPLASGYVGLPSLFDPGNVLGNIGRYTRWMFASHGVAIALAALPLIVRPARPPWLTPRAAAPLAAYALIVGASYVFYVQFDDWWYLRFMLPVLPLAFMLLGTALVWAARWLPRRGAGFGLMLATALVLGGWWRFADSHGVRTIGAGEARYAAVAQYIHREMPGEAIVIARQHTGPVWFYSGRQTVRYDFFAPPRLTAAAEWLRDHGRQPYLVLEDWEEADFKRRFAGQGALGRLDVLVLAEMTQPVRVRIYDPLSPPSALPPRPITIAPSGRCAEPAGPWKP